ncbi:uncharacterized protein VTP21DRAFT_11465 [Calcarisporiella thermophila]|uniref:uncharacterized protein n=1 Tax=Calcarisporiella thermophila TaxID=911321 RepID=UPI0037433C02
MSGALVARDLRKNKKFLLWMEVTNLVNSIEDTSEELNKAVSKRRVAQHGVADGLHIRINLCTLSDLQGLLHDYLIYTSQFSPSQFRDPSECLPRIIKRIDFDRFSSLERPKDGSPVPDLWNKTTMTRHPLAYQLFQVYLSPKCLLPYYHFDSAGLLESFLRDELDHAFLYSALAWAAHHVHQFHKEAPFDDQLRLLAKRCFEESEKRIRDVFDEPSLITLLTFLNLSMHLCDTPNSKDAYAYLTHAITISRLLGIDWDNANETNPILREGKRRIWWTLHCIENFFVLYEGMTRTIIPPSNLHAYIPRELPHEKKNKHVHEALQSLISMVVWNTALINRPDLDLSLPDEKLFKSVVEVVACIKPFLPGFSKGDIFRQKSPSQMDICLGISQWGAWARLWFQFLNIQSSNLPAARLETPLMHSLRSIAIVECIRASSMISLALPMMKECLPTPLISVMFACRIHRMILRHHRNLKVRREALRQLKAISCALKTHPVCRLAFSFEVVQLIGEIFNENDVQLD